MSNLDSFIADVEAAGADKAPEHPGRWWCGDRQQWIYEPEGQEKLYTQAELDAAVQKERARCAGHMYILMSRVEKERDAFATSGRAVDKVGHMCFKAFCDMLRAAQDEIEDVYGSNPLA